MAAGDEESGVTGGTSSSCGCRHRFRRGATQVLISETVCKTGNPMFKRFTTVTHSNVWTRRRGAPSARRFIGASVIGVMRQGGWSPRSPMPPPWSPLRMEEALASPRTPRRRPWYIEISRHRSRGPRTLGRVSLPEALLKKLVALLMMINS